MFRVRAISDYKQQPGRRVVGGFPDYDVDEEDTWRTGRGRWMSDQNGWW